MCNRYGQRQTAAEDLHAIGEIYVRLGDPDRAIRNYQQSLRIRRELDHPHGIATTLWRLGLTLAARGCHGEARDCWEKAHRVFAELGVAETSAVLALLDGAGPFPDDLRMPAW